MSHVHQPTPAIAQHLIPADLHPLAAEYATLAQAFTSTSDEFFAAGAGSAQEAAASRDAAELVEAATSGAAADPTIGRRHSDALAARYKLLAEQRAAIAPRLAEARYFVAEQLADAGAEVVDRATAAAEPVAAKYASAVEKFARKAEQLADELDRGLADVHADYCQAVTDVRWAEAIRSSNPLGRPSHDWPNYNAAAVPVTHPAAAALRQAAAVARADARRHETTNPRQAARA